VQAGHFLQPLVPCFQLQITIKSVAAYALFYWSNGLLNSEIAAVKRYLSNQPQVYFKRRLKQKCNALLRNVLQTMHVEFAIVYIFNCYDNFENAQLNQWFVIFKTSVHIADLAVAFRPRVPSVTLVPINVHAIRARIVRGAISSRVV
jgi:hypothetical protein